jgi:hypothetical protein
MAEKVIRDVPQRDRQGASAMTIPIESAEFVYPTGLAWPGIGIMALLGLAVLLRPELQILHTHPWLFSGAGVAGLVLTALGSVHRHRRAKRSAEVRSDGIVFDEALVVPLANIGLVWTHGELPNDPSTVRITTRSGGRAELRMATDTQTAEVIATLMNANQKPQRVVAQRPWAPAAITAATMIGYGAGVLGGGPVVVLAALTLVGGLYFLTFGRAFLDRNQIRVVARFGSDKTYEYGEVQNVEVSWSGVTAELRQGRLLGLRLSAVADDFLADFMRSRLQNRPTATKAD